MSSLLAQWFCIRPSEHRYIVAGEWHVREMWRLCQRDECQLTNRTMYVCARCDIFSQSEMMLRSGNKGLAGNLVMCSWKCSAFIQVNCGQTPWSEVFKQHRRCIYSVYDVTLSACMCEYIDIYSKVIHMSQVRKILLKLVKFSL